VLTLDTPVVGTKYDGAGPTVWDLVDPGHLRVNFPAGDDGSGAADKATDLGPDDIAWLTARTGLPVVAKGVLRPVDARRCVEAGAAAVWVSTHGGRQLDGALDTATCLPAVAAEVGSSAEVYVDGGLREARHVLAALGLGARGVFLGRPPVYALAVDGAAGVGTLLRELEEALAESLALSGCASVGDLHADLVVRPGTS
jgi:4-hydroxymandelate oxidase